MYLDFTLSEQESLGLFSISCFFWIFKLLKQPKFPSNKLSANFLLPIGSHERKVSALVQSLSCVQLFVTPWTAACQTSLSITNSRSLPKLTSIKSVMPSNHLILCPSAIPFSSCLQSFPTSRSFQMSQLFASGGQNIGVSASTSVLPMNTQDWFPLDGLKERKI